MNRKICVFCSSSDAVAPAFIKVAAELGAFIAERNYTLVYGGGNIGLMGTMAHSVHTNGGKVVGVIPKMFKDKGLAYKGADEMIVTEDLRERKKIMEALSDAFVGLPGGFGTLEEILEIITLKQIRFHQKPIVLLNTNSFFMHLINLFEYMYLEKFAKEEYRKLYFVASNVKSTFSYIEAYQKSKNRSELF